MSTAEYQDKADQDLSKWLLFMVSGVNVVLSFVLIVTGVTCQRYIINGVLAAWALVVIGLLTVALSLLSTYLLQKEKNMLGVLVNTKIIMMIFLGVFALGLLSFLPDLDVYVYDNWA